jgi:cytochrome b561
MSVRNTTTRWGGIAQLLHWLIVALIITQVTLASIAEDLPLGVKKLAMYARHKWFGFAQLPDLVPRNRELYETLKSTHDNLALVLYGVVGLHVLGALKHHFVMRDDVLRRMLPFTKSR